MIRGLLVALMVCISSTAWGDAESVAAIKAAGLKRSDGLTLTGNLIRIGQVEPGRTASPTFDTDAVNNEFVPPFETKLDNGRTPGEDEFVDAHSIEVAGVIIGSIGAPTSVARNTYLYSVGYGGSINPDQEISSTQYLAKRFPFSNVEHIRAINHSWGGGALEGPFSGDSRETLGLDWIASQFDVLNVIAGAESGSAVAPSDNFNGVTVAFMAEEAGGGYVRVATDNDNDEDRDAVGNRVSVDLLAPGAGLTLATAGVGNPITVQSAGTSFAAPHVTGTVALLYEYGDFEVAQPNNPRWDSANTRKHEVMKAVLLNSADKLDGVHGSTREILDENGNNWLQSPAYLDDFGGNAANISLDQQMGALALPALWRRRRA